MAVDTPRLTIDVQPGHGGSSLLIFVTGQVSVNGDNPLLFSQSFNLVFFLDILLMWMYLLFYG